MKSIVRSLVAASACGLFALVNQTAHAQVKPAAAPAPAGAKKPHRPSMLDVWTKQLSLTPAQVNQLKPVLKARGDKHKSIDDALLTAKDRRDQLKAVDAAFMIQASAILTPAQRAKYMAMTAKKAPAAAPKKP